MKLQFPIGEVAQYAQQYEDGLVPRERELTHEMTQRVFPAYKTRGFLLKEEFLTVCRWKTRRSQSRCEKNDEFAIKEISSLVLTTQSEALKIQLWTILSGVKWPTASVFLHFAFENQYPILDFRALWSLGLEDPPLYTLAFWKSYTEVCRSLAAEAGMSMRALDQALWKYSELHQPKKA